MGRIDAVRILKGEHLSNDLDQPKYERYVAVCVSQTNLRKLCPFKMESYLNNKYKLNEIILTLTGRDS